MKTMSIVSKMSECPETLEEARGLIDQLEARIERLTPVAMGIRAKWDFGAMKEAWEKSQTEVEWLRLTEARLVVERKEHLDELVQLRADKETLRRLLNLAETVPYAERNSTEQAAIDAARKDGAAMNAPMLPEPVECGTPCGACEALAHEAARLRELVDWAETLLCNSLPMQHSTPEEWSDLIHKWRDKKHGAALVGEVQK